MLSDDIIYLILLLACIAFGPVVRQIPGAKCRQLFSTALGIFIVFILSGFDIIHPFILTCVNAYIVLHTKKRFCHVVSFVFSFSYLMFLRISSYFGLREQNEFTNTIQMIMTLKMVGLAYEVNLTYLLSKSSDEKDKLKMKFQSIQLMCCDVIQYSFCYAGVLVGPYYKFRTYYDMIHCPYTSHVPCASLLLRRLAIAPLYIFLYLLFDHIFPLHFASSGEILERPFWYRVFYMTPLFFNFRMKMYAAFVLGECICISLGLGAYPEESNPQPGAGPTNFAALSNFVSDRGHWSDYSFNFETVRSMDEYTSEFRPTMREGIRYWNMTVQYWLYVFIYQKTQTSKPGKIVMTMFASAIWHGIRPGYYLSLLGTPLLLISEIEVEKAFRKNASPQGQQIFKWVWYFVKMKSLAYMGMAFIILDVNDILHYWKSIYFVGHIFIIVIHVIAFVKNRLYCKPHVS